MRISKYKKIFAKGYVLNWPEVFVIKKSKNTVSQTYLTGDLNIEKLLELFTKSSYQKQIKKKFRTEKKVKQKVNKIHVKSKCYNNSFNRWIDKIRSCYIK